MSGKVFCKECGKAMVGNKRYSGRNKELYTTYRCPTYKYACNNKEINREYLEGYVVELLERDIFNLTALKCISKQLDEKPLRSTFAQSDSQTEKELEEVNQALQNIADAISSGLISDALIAKLRELEEQKQSLEARVQEAQAMTEASSTPIDTSRILSEYAEVRQSPALPTYKAFVSSFIDRIDVGKYIVDITLKTGLDVCPNLNTTYHVRRQEIYDRK